MPRTIFLTFLVLALTAIASAQPSMTRTYPDLAKDVAHTAPVIWQRYKVADRGISFILPKMPVMHVVPSMCGELKSITYLAYGEGVIYEVVIAGPRRSSTQVNCGGKIVS